jgi:hypothetical protein
MHQQYMEPVVVVDLWEMMDLQDTVVEAEAEVEEKTLLDNMDVVEKVEMGSPK